jgi:hypothetical protein
MLSYGMLCCPTKVAVHKYLGEEMEINGKGEEISPPIFHELIGLMGKDVQKQFLENLTISGITH